MELPERLAGGKTLAGLDLGDKTIGVAVSDRGLSFAHPRPVILRKKFSADAAQLLAQLDRDNVGAIVLGLPVNMDGSEGPRAQKSRAFARNMAPLSDLPFVLWDERLSTVGAERTLIEMDFSRRKRAGKALPDPFGDVAPPAEGPKPHEQEKVENAGPRHHARDDSRIDTEHLAVKLESEIVHLSAQHRVAEIHVVGR